MIQTVLYFQYRLYNLVVVVTPATMLIPAFVFIAASLRRNLFNSISAGSFSLLHKTAAAHFIAMF